MKQAFAVVSDMHLSGHQKVNRFNYDKELHVVFHKIIELVQVYNKREFDVHVVFLGDIFDKSYKTPEKYGIDSSFFVMLRNMTKGLFVCVGNHELNFYQNNPFWTLVSEISSGRINALSGVNTQPLGYDNVFNVVDRIEFSNCVFHFNHYSCSDLPPSFGKINIAFYHKPVYNHLMVDDAVKNGLKVEYAKGLKGVSTSTFDKYDYVFLGHMHWLYGMWKTDNTIIYGLASLGRPSKAEVSNQFLERNIPVILVEQGSMQSIEDNYFNLPSREETIIKEVDKKQKNNYEILNRKKKATSYTSITDNPIHNIRTFLIENLRVLSLFDSLADKSFSDSDLIDRHLDIERRSRL